MSSYSQSFRLPATVDFFTVFHVSGVARPWLVTTYAQSVVWSSLSNSVQSSATTISLREAITNPAHAGVRRATSMAVLLRKRSTCFTPKRGFVRATSA